MRKTGKRKSRILFCILVAVMVLAVFPTAAASSAPSDMAGHWAEAQITDWIAKGLIKGFPDGNFRPDRDISRAEFISLVNRAFGYEEKAAVAFKDVPQDAWFADEVAKARAAGYISGYGDGTMRPGNPITRQEAAAVIMRVRNLAPDVKAAERFKDAGDIPAWSKGAVGAAAVAGAMGGCPDGTFRAGRSITRAEAVAALARTVALGPVQASVVYDKAGTYGPAEGTATVKGSVTIKARDVVLRNTVIDGDLIIDEAVGDGDVTLRNVTIKGTACIYGGGADSVHFVDARAPRAVVLKKNGMVRIVTSGRAEIGQLVAQSGVVAEEADLTGKGFTDIIVDKQVAGRVDLNLVGVRVGNLEVRSGEVTVGADGKTAVGTLQVKADNVTVNTAKGTTITTLVADGKVAVTGQGTIQKAEVNVSGVTFETKPEIQTVAEGVEPPAVTPSAPTGGGGGGSAPTVTVTAITGATVSIACGSIDYDYDFAVDGQPVTYAQAFQAPYYLDPNASTVKLSDGTNNSNAVTLASLDLDNDGKKTYSGMQEMNSGFVISDDWFPTQVVITLKSKTSADGKTVANPWQKTFTIDISGVINVFKINADADALFLKDTLLNPVVNTVTGDLRLASTGLFGSVVTWQSNDSCINVGTNASNGYYPAAVTRDDSQNKTVTLTASLALGSEQLTKTFTVTVPAKETLVVTASDPDVLLDADSKTPSGSDNYWLLSITNSNPNITVKDDVQSDAVTVSPEKPLPQGFSYSVTKNGPREIRITLKGEAGSPVDNLTEVGFVVTPEAVKESGFKASAPVTVHIAPPGAGLVRIQVDTQASDLTVSMDVYNTQPAPADNTWVLKITSPAVKQNVSLGDLTITGLPAGLGVQSVVLDQEPNAIIITIGGTAASPVTQPVNVGIVVKGSAANVDGYLDSNQVTAVIAPAATYAVTVADVVGGTATVTANPPVAAAGETVTVTINNIENGKQFKSIAVKDADNNNVTTTEQQAGVAYTFVMPAGAVTVTVEVEAALTDAEKVAADKAALTADVIKGSNTDLDHVVANLNLINAGAMYGSSIVWGSSNGNLIDGSGTVTRAAYAEGNQTVTLTAQITSGSATDTKQFTVTVLAMTPAEDPTPPQFTGAVVSGHILTLSYNEHLYVNSPPAVDDFVVVVNGANATITSSGIGADGYTVDLSLSGAVNFGATVTLSYTRGASPIQDLAGNQADNLSNVSVTNNTP